jgi:hypothetical protein
MMDSEIIPHSRPSISDRDIEAVASVLNPVNYHKDKKSRNLKKDWPASSVKNRLLRQALARQLSIWLWYL